MNDSSSAEKRHAGPEVRPHVLREYALLADGVRGALVGPDGHVVWLCVPHWHDQPVFAALLGGRGGYQVAPTDPWAVWSGSYRPGSLVWRSRWATAEDIIHCVEALAMPGDDHTAVLLRRIEAGDQPARMHVELDPRAGYRQSALSELRRHDGTWTARLNGLWLRWSGAAEAVPADGEERLCLTLDVPAGGHHDLVLEMSDRPFSGPPPNPDVLWRTTESTWRSLVPDFGDTIAPGDAAHSYAVLRGLTTGTGGMVAAATTSLPERERAGENYDYRFAWIRDQCWVGLSIAAHGPHEMMGNAVKFVTERLLADGPRLRPAYTTDGGPVPEEESLRLPGYPGGGDVIGNQVTHQFQLDVFGEALQLFAAAARHGDLDLDTWRAAEVAVQAIDQRWAEPDAGLWELDRHMWTESRLACVAGLRALAAVAPRTTDARLSDRADALLAEIGPRGLHPDGRWRRAVDDDRVDAALLLSALRGAVPPDDPRSVATIRAVRDELCDDGYVYRFRHAHRRLGEAEGAFLVCGFILALAVDQQGDTADALRLFERNRSACGPPGLLAEEYDVTRRQLRGNLPQAFVHGMLVEAATRLAH